MRQGPDRAGRALILCDGPVTAPGSGSERVAHHQALGMKAAGWDVAAITRRPGPPGPAVRTEAAGFPEISVPAPASRPRAFFSTLFQAWPRAYDRLFPEGPPDVVVTHQPLPWWVLRLAGRLGSAPVLHVFHSPWHQEYAAASPGRPAPLILPGALARRGAEGAVVRRAARVMALSRYMADKARQFHGVDLDRLVVNPGGADPQRFFPAQDREAVRRSLSPALPPDRVLLFTLRNLEPRMGLDRLLSAMATLERDSPRRFHLVIGGSGPERERLLALRSDLGLSDAVTLAGYVAEEDLATWYQAADFFILPTARLEGFGLVTAEALACGTPVLGTPVGATPEILTRISGKLLFADASPESMARGIAARADRMTKDPDGYEALRRSCR
ncbi:MAG: glycosyltransferase family 4 protein, partial [Pseudomonadota bacterium]